MNVMNRVIKFNLPKDDNLIQTIQEYNSAVNFCMVTGKEHHTYNKNDIHKLTYYEIRDNSNLSSSMVCCARDQASDMLKREKLKTLPVKKDFSGIRYNQRTFTWKEGYLSIGTLLGRKTYTPFIPRYFNKYLTKLNEVKALTIYYKNNKIRCQMIIEIPDVEKLEVKNILGIDRGIINPVVSSNNRFFNSKRIRKIKGQYSWLKSKLQQKGTKSAKRKLKKLSGREKRFVENENHKLAKEIVAMNFECFALEDLSIKKTKQLGKVFNRKLSGWSYFQFQKFLEYKAENLGKQVVYVKPNYTSQCCSMCGHIDKNNRTKSNFKCNKCSFELNADLNASRNIAELGKAFFSRLPVNQPIVTNLGLVTSHSL
jgi:putative transposase